jgi:branched-chain amino acid aminotransferase
MLWYNGSFVDSASTDAMGHSLHYGTGVFEGIRFYETAQGPAIFRLADHMKRLFYSAQVMGLEVPYSEAELTQAVIDTVKQSGLTSGYIRPLIFYGEGPLGVIPKQNKVNTIIGVLPWDKYFDKHAVHVYLSDMIRPHPLSTDMKAKISGNYQNSMLAGKQAKSKGCDEALLLDYQGNVAEGSAANFFLISDKQIITPKLGTILPGITRDSVMVLAREMGCEVVERDIKPDELGSAQEAFFTGTAAEVTLIYQINQKVYIDATVSKKLQDAYSKLVVGQAGHPEWLTFVK